MFIKWVAPILLASAATARQPWPYPPGDGKSQSLGDPGNQTAYLKQELFKETLEALRVMQDAYFQPWVGTWPKAIDWTAAVMGSHIAGALVSLSRGLDEVSEDQATDNMISFYFTHLISFYFGQNALSLRHQAYDDMLWVVLNWLDTVQFISEYSSTRSLSLQQTNSSVGAMVDESLRTGAWYGNQWIPAFAHRARIFWELGSQGWDETLCGGGMFWNPRLGPYKNAITNELFISASASMYQFFPGDRNTSPYNFGEVESSGDFPNTGEPEDWQPHDPMFLASAVKGYRWLLASNMTNDQGLFADGFHMSNYPGNNTKCDRRDEAVFTYNQGVILTGQRELFKALGSWRYIQDGHRLIQNVIRATGWNLARDEPVDDLKKLRPGELPPWHGLGRAGILEEMCDASGRCSQNSHTFKGIWMHHFTAFCAPLEINAAAAAAAESGDISVEGRQLSHSEACQRYLPWIRHNAFAAMGTRDSEGKFGMWWTVGLLNITIDNLQFGPESQPACPGEYTALLCDPLSFAEGGDPGAEYHRDDSTPEEVHLGNGADNLAQKPMGVVRKRGASVSSSDPNSRFRGRTVETQGGGLAVLRALWELLNQDVE